MDGTSQQGINIGRGALQAIFAVFLGLMITAVVGVGVYTFYPNPADDLQEQIEQLWDERAAIEGCGQTPGECRTWEQLTAEEQARAKDIEATVTGLQREADDMRSGWAQRTSVVLVVIATALMATSLLLGDSVAVLSNGILLGGLFTMLYGVGWVLASGNSVMRFVVLLVALIVSLGLGYVKFVRRREGGRTRPAMPAAGAVGGGGAAAAAVPADALGDLAARVADLERRLSAAAQWLGAPSPRAPSGEAAGPSGEAPGASGSRVTGSPGDA